MEAANSHINLRSFTSRNVKNRDGAMPPDVICCKFKKK
jgi:hypothetical protein